MFGSSTYVVQTKRPERINHDILSCVKICTHINRAYKVSERRSRVSHQSNDGTQRLGRRKMLNIIILPPAKFRVAIRIRIMKGLET